MKILIHGDKWNIKVLEDDAFERKFGEMLSGVTQTDKKQIHISVSGFNIQTLVHEIAHCYYYYSCTEAANLTTDQIEEIWCEIIAIHGQKIIKDSKKIFKILKKSL